MLSTINQEIAASIAAKQAALADEALLEQLAALSQTCVDSLKAGGKVILAGNGGSFADAQHLAAEFVCRFRRDRAPLPGLVLGANASLATAISNDYGYDRIFARELEAMATSQDVFIAISTSGNSGNIIQAVKAANKLGIHTVAFTGDTGGQLAALCDCIKVPSSVTARIQECHILFGHIICGIVEDSLFPETHLPGGNV
ncbi:SIS domain-containing protein [Cohaesibacter sp. CAU 1516]|uniref:D-sedoheptulose-7-phosphate isomerase n=1 Tax=Cohaesibacter sp. CAU 1516 TaxID=2576038 RepID=UPI0010FED52D|nr:SIS domain-containing protein [Cohaesibacter sp. CAU 1516]TLP48520.1 SIS domain-containing protein [Cohaesibacter sp. CAU 1516]